MHTAYLIRKSSKAWRAQVRQLKHKLWKPSPTKINSKIWYTPEINVREGDALKGRHVPYRELVEWNTRRTHGHGRQGAGAKANAVESMDHEEMQLSENRADLDHAVECRLRDDHVGQVQIVKIWQGRHRRMGDIRRAKAAAMEI